MGVRSRPSSSARAAGSVGTSTGVESGYGCPGVTVTGVLARVLAQAPVAAGLAGCLQVGALTLGGLAAVLAMASLAQVLLVVAPPGVQVGCGAGCWMCSGSDGDRLTVRVTSLGALAGALVTLETAGRAGVLVVVLGEGTGRRTSWCTSDHRTCWSPGGGRTGWRAGGHST